MAIVDATVASKEGKKELSPSVVEFLSPLSGLQLPYWVQFAREPGAGMVQVQFWLSGIESIDLLQRAWYDTQQQFQCLRATVNVLPTHKPVLVFRRSVDSAIASEDWSALTDVQQEERISEYLASDLQNVLELDKAPSSRFFCARLGQDSFYCLWTCHHLLFDGWSAAVIINRLLLNYKSQLLSGTATLMHSPDYVDYRNFADKQSKKPSEEFWLQSLRGFNQPTVICNQPAEPVVFRSLRHLSRSETELLTNFCKSKAVTFGTLVQVAWALVCAWYLNRSDVMFGLITHGRGLDFAGVDHVVGQLSNVIPVRARIDSEQAFSEWIKLFQVQQFEAGNHAHLSLNEVLSLSEPATRTLAFDSVLAIETMPAIQPSEFSVPAVTHYRSNMISSFPINVTVVPSEQINITIEIRDDIIGEELADGLNDKLHEILSKLPDIFECSPDAFLRNSNPVPANMIRQPGFQIRNAVLKNIVGARTEFELQVLSIWEEVLQTYPLSMDSNFFDSGGNSLGALRLLADINNTFNIEMSLAHFIENPSIRSMCDYLNAEKDSVPIKSLVLLRKGTKDRNLFCLHAGGGHALFYRSLALRIDASYSIYALQPKELGGESVPSDSVSDMVDNYLDEIVAAQPQGPYNLLCYCFGAALTLEIIKKLQASGEVVGDVIIADAMAPIPSRHPMSIFGWKAYILYELIVQGEYGNIFNVAQHQLYRWYDTLSLLKKRSVSIKGRASDEQYLKETVVLDETSAKMDMTESNLRGHSSKVQTACERAFHKYRASASHTHIHFLRSDSSTRQNSFDVFMRHWHTLAPNRTEHKLKASHAEVMVEPFVADTAKVVNSILEK